MTKPHPPDPIHGKPEEPKEWDIRKLHVRPPDLSYGPYAEVFARYTLDFEATVTEALRLGGYVDPDFTTCKISAHGDGWNVDEECLFIAIRARDARWQQTQEDYQLLLTEWKEERAKYDAAFAKYLEDHKAWKRAQQRAELGRLQTQRTHLNKQIQRLSNKLNNGSQ